MSQKRSHLPAGRPRQWLFQDWGIPDRLAHWLGHSLPQCLSRRVHAPVLGSHGTNVARRLLPWHTDLGKRELKARKVYVRDSGVLHSLLGMKTRADLLSHPKLGASWEGYAPEQVLVAHRKM